MPKTQPQCNDVPPLTASEEKINLPMPKKVGILNARVGIFFE
jgi:hypothetical protein